MPSPADRAGQLPREEDLLDVPATLAAYAALVPDPADPAQRVSFGTSGHRGAAARRSFNDPHVAAITQAIVEHRAAAGVTGPMFVGRDSHALSAPALDTVLAVLVANGVEVRTESDGTFTPTPGVSHAILAHNRGRDHDLADGIVITPSHNPPEDGGIKYNPPTGGPATTETGAIEAAANALLEAGSDGVRRVDLDGARGAVVGHAIREAYVADLPAVVDLEAVARNGVRLYADPMGGAAAEYYPAIADAHGLDITTAGTVDPTFRMIPLDWDGRIRMDCSSPHAMAGVVATLADGGGYDLAVGNDADADRHGVVLPGLGLIDPNSYLATSVDHLLRSRPGWPASLGVGVTVVTSDLVSRIARQHGREVVEVPVGFKWYVDGLVSGRLAFGGEESAGATLARFDGTPWTTDKDGIVMCLLAAEMLVATDGELASHVEEVRQRFGRARFRRVDTAATREQKARLKALSPDRVSLDTLAGDPVTAVQTTASGNDAAIGGMKVRTENGWFVARPSGTEDVNKVYAESFVSEDHLETLLTEAAEVVAAATAAG